MKRASSQSGLVSILSVMFFMIFISILMVGFMKLINDEQRQALDNDLSASALAAARSGVEDGKRILLYCKHNPTDAGCASFLSAPGCSGLGLSQAQSMLGALDISTETTNGVTEGVATSNDDGGDSYAQRYRCLRIQRQSSTVEGITIPKGESVLIPLDYAGTTPPSQLTIRWHLTGNGGDGPINLSGADPTELPVEADWGNRPAMLRAQLIPYIQGNYKPSEINSQSMTAFFYPNATTTGSHSYASYDRPKSAQCDTAVTSGYSCSQVITGLTTSPLNGKRFYVRLMPIYRQATIQLSMQNSGQPVDFLDVQPTIDSTGRVSDVYRRIAAKIDYASDYFQPEYALDSSRGLCKMVTRTPDGLGNFKNDCVVQSGMLIDGAASIGATGGNNNPTGVACWKNPDFGMNHPECWTVARLNKTPSYKLEGLVSCSWDWGDGPTSVLVYPASAPQCQTDGKAKYAYPVRSMGTPPKRLAFNLTLTNTYSDGSTVKTTVVVHAPR